MILKYNIIKLQTLTVICNIVIVFIFIFAFHGCNGEDYLYEKEIVYSSEENGFHLYDNSVIPSSIKAKLSDSEFELLCSLCAEYGVYFLDPKEYSSKKIKQIENVIEVQDLLDIDLSSAEFKVERVKGPNRLSINMPRLKTSSNENYQEYSIKQAEVYITTIINSITQEEIGQIYLKWAYLFNDTEEIALNVSNVSVSMTGFYGLICTFSGTKAVELLENKIEFSYLVDGSLVIGVSIGNLAIGIPTSAQFNYSGSYLCPID
jgi:hypothetical protein